ncbi:MAG: 2-hydroxyacyl-CoA dehydratase [Deltaproteobacteria bacterium]|nr:2-hydroxyacyl-CoA dehydratase [Deltaproteobacteria bacterium]
MTRSADEIIKEATTLASLDLAHVRAWKAGSSTRRAIGCMPVFAPREVLWAAGALPVLLRGGGDQLETLRGDALYQSYICHIPRSTLELAWGGWLDVLDGMVFPNTCDVIRNLSGTWHGLFAGKPVRFLDPPHARDPESGVSYWRDELTRLYEGTCTLSGCDPSDAALWAAIDDYVLARRAVRALSEARVAEPWNVPADDAYLLRRAGDSLPPRDHAKLIEEYLAAVKLRRAHWEDRIRVVVVGAFCEHPPLGLLRAIERAGCYIIEDDLFLSSEDVVGEIAADRQGRRALEAIARGYITQGAKSSVRYDEAGSRGQELAARVRELGADGVIFAAPSFCDPALLDQPRLARVLDDEGIPHASFKYSENVGQFQGFREQAGTFCDSVKLWGRA